MSPSKTLLNVQDKSRYAALKDQKILSGQSVTANMSLLLATMTFALGMGC